jgi:hypothetical protein
LSSTGQTVPSLATRMAHAREADRQKLRLQVMAAHPGLDSAAVEAEVERLLFERRSAGGRKGAERTAARHAIAREVLAAIPVMLATAEEHAAQLRKFAALAEDVA